ncbi:hypothetical protein ASD16_09365 [Cellulomonas sp. Root485]|nr:hypothetical protein ASD16_09365 [Cellulomonas sp. Root485]
MVVALLPELPGEVTLTRATFVEFENAARETRVGTLGGREDRHFKRASVGYQRLRADDTEHNATETPYGAVTELHTDGAGAVAVRLFVPDGADPTVLVLSDELLAETIAWSLQYLAVHAHERAYADGMAEVRVSVRPAVHVGSTVIGNWRAGNPAVAGRRLSSPPTVSTFAQIGDLAEGGVGMVAAAARLHHALGHAYGYPELPQLTLDGGLVWAFWQGARRAALKDWAQEHRVPIVDEG